MNPAVREWLRREVDKRQRETVPVPVLEPVLCGHCGVEIPPDEIRHRPGKKFCCYRHQQYGWLKTERGRIYKREAKRRQYARKRENAVPQ